MGGFRTLQANENPRHSLGSFENVDLVAADSPGKDKKKKKNGFLSLLNHVSPFKHTPSKSQKKKNDNTTS